MAEVLVFQPTPMANILESLCPELIVEIFSYLKISDLCRVARVCKQFKELAYSKTLWKEVILRWFSGSPPVDEDFVKTLMQKGIRCLGLYLYKYNMELHKFRELLPELQKLHFKVMSSDSCPLDLLHEVTKNVSCPALKSLGLVWWSSPMMSKVTLVEFLEQFSNLEDLGLINFIGSEEKVYNKEQNGIVQKLKYLCICFRDCEVPVFSTQFYSSLILDELVLISAKINGNTLRSIVQCFPNLWSLTFTICYYAGIDFVEKCCEYLGNLKELRIVFCDNVSKKNAESIRKLMKNVDVKYWSPN